MISLHILIQLFLSLVLMSFTELGGSARGVMIHDGTLSSTSSQRLQRRDDFPTDADSDMPDFSLISDRIDPLTLNFSSNDVEAIQESVQPIEQSDELMTQIQQANNMSLENVLDDVIVNASGVVQSNDSPISATSPLQPRSVQLVDARGDRTLYGGPDGNFVLVPTDSQGGGLHFKYIAGTVVTDDLNRLMFYYPDMMEKYNVSRFRINDVKRIPKGARLIALSSFFLEDDSHATFLAADTKGNSFQLLTCSYADGVTPSRVFLAKDAVAANKQLQQPEMQAVMTGSAIVGCDYIKYADITAPPRS